MSDLERFNVDPKYDYDISKYAKLAQDYKNNPLLYLSRRYDLYTKVIEFEDVDFKLELQLLKSPNGVFTLHISNPNKKDIKSIKFSEKLRRKNSSNNPKHFNTLTKDDYLFSLTLNNSDDNELQVKIDIAIKPIELNLELEDDISSICNQIYDKNYLLMAQLLSNNPIQTWTLTQPRIQDGENPTSGEG